MKSAIIDLGTNTFHLIIADINGTNKKVLYKTSLPVKLGEGRINENLIIPDAFNRGIAALKSFKKEINNYQVTVVKAIATSAIRSAANGDDFIKDALLETGIEITVISGDEEADYIYKGVKDTGVLTHISLIMDIGGGSTEFIICDQRRILWKKSYNIGAARLQQAYFKSDPISLENQLSIQNRLESELFELQEACKRYKPQQLVGSAGAFETFSGMINPDVDIRYIKSTEIDISAYHLLSKKLIKSTHNERQNFDRLIKLRVDMIVIAALITNYVFKLNSFHRLFLSTYDLKMGVLCTLQELNT
ncbi:Ppx/GppA phosphatase family protein [Pedobacter sp. UYP24]